MWWWWWWACAPQATLLLDPDPERTGEDGTDGPHGAAVLRVHAAARVSDVVAVDLVFPADADGAPAVSGAPTVVLVHGGFVDPERYRWLAAHLASRGVAVALPESPSHLALLAPGDAEVALGALREASAPDGPLPDLAPDGPVVAAGHSLGGVVAGNWFLEDPELVAAVELASWPSVAPPADLDRDVLALVGSLDGSAPPDTIAEVFEGWPGPLFFGEVDGMTHYAWTDEPSAPELAKEPAPSRPVPELRQDAQRVIDAFLDDAFGGPEPFEARLFPNVRWR